MKKIIYISILLFVVFSCKETQNKQTSNEHQEEAHDDHEITISKKQFIANDFKLGGLEKRDFPETVTANGMIDVPPQSKQIITSFYGGTIQKSNLLIGDKVHKGQALVTIENPEFITLQQEYLEIKEQLAYLQNEYKRQKTLFEEQITSQKKYLEAKSKYQKQVAKLYGLKKQLQLLHISPKQVEAGKMTSTITLYAKINGYVTKVNVSTGTYISPNDVILEIVNTNHIHVELTVFEKDIMKIKKGQEILFKIPEASNKEYEAEVHLVGTSIDENNRSIKVHGHLHKETKNNFVVGMFVEAKIIVDKKSLPAIPEEAVVEIDGKNYVLILEEENKDSYRFEKVTVSVLRKNDQYVAIQSPKISATTKILTKGAFDLLGEVGEDEH